MNFNNNNLLKLHTILHDALPEMVDAKNVKNDKSNYIAKDKALHRKFIRYNTKKCINVLMFDVDNVNMSLVDYMDYLVVRLGIKPTFLLRSSNGFHFGLILNRPVWANNLKEVKKIKNLKKEISDIIEADKNGSHRLLGIWRNPLEHDFIFTDKKYALETLISKIKEKRSNELKKEKNDFLDDISDFEFQDKTITKKVCGGVSNLKIKKRGLISNSIEKGFVVGNRNNYLFAVGYSIVFEDRGKVYSLNKELDEINRSHSNPLTEYEVGAICKSILNFTSSMYLPKNKVKGRFFDEMQSLGIHGVYNRRAYSGYRIAQERSIESTKKIIGTLIKFFEKGVQSPSNNDISNELNISVRTYQRAKKKISPLNIFMLWIKGLSEGREIDIRPYVIPLTKRVFVGVKKRVEKLLDNTIVISELQKSEILQMRSKAPV